MSFKKIFRIRTGALIAVAFAGISASAGGMDSGGGDLRAPDSGAAWFLGTRPVRYCLRLSPDFGLEQERVQEELNEALSQWREYLLERMIPEWASDLPLHLNLERMDRCTGSEDLRFDFGWRDPEVDAAMKDYESPVAFAHRAQYDPKAGWGKGFLWFAPDRSLGGALPQWDAPKRLRGMLLHELGHVLGIGHLEKTIMSEGIAKLTVKMPDPLSEDMAQAALSRIDRQRELVLCTDCTYLSRSKWPGEWSEAEESLFLRIFGRLPAGDYRLGARIVGNKQGLLVLRDQLGEMSAIVLETVGKPVLLGRTFKTYWTEKAEPTASQKARGMEAPFLGLDIEGVVLGMHGERIGVRILHNLGSAPLEVLIKRGESPALSWYTARLP